MNIHYHLQKPAKVLDSPMPFMDWRYVQPEHISWIKGSDSYSYDENAVIDPRYRHAPHGIAIRGLPAEKREIELLGEPWESYGVGAAGHATCNFLTIIQEGGIYKGWYNALGREQIDNATQKNPNFTASICYAESDDGVTWRKPELNIMPFQGQKTNIVFGTELSDGWAVHAPSVFSDPSAPEDERYKMIWMSSVEKSKIAPLIDSYRDQEGILEHWLKQERLPCVAGAVSADGIHWKSLPEPLVLHYSDTQTVASFDTLLGRYVGYFRMHYNNRRLIGRAETSDFHRWPYPAPILQPGPEDRPFIDYYLSCKTLYPGTRDAHLMFVNAYDRFNDISEIRLAVSDDGMAWHFVPGGPVIGHGEPGQWDGAYKAAFPNLLCLPNGDAALHFVGTTVPHKYSRYQGFERGNALAVWPQGRLTCIAADEEGEFTTCALKCSGQELHLNVQTKHAGYVKVGVLDENGIPVRGRGIEEAVSVCGDFGDHIVRWQTGTDLGADDRPIMLHFRLRSAKLFTFHVR